MPDTVTLTHLHGTPVFAVNSRDSSYLRVYGSTYIPERGTYVFPAFYPFHEYIEHDLSVIEAESVLDQKAQDWLALQRTYADKIKSCELDPRFKHYTPPYAHQREAIAFGVYNLRCGLFLDMGLGKTYCAAEIIRYVRDFGGGAKALVIVPLVILYKWAEEVIRHSGGTLKPIVLDGTPKKKAKLLKQPGDVFITTFKAAANMYEQLIELDYNMLIVDESHNLQTHNSDKTVALSYLSRKAPRRILMSGTASLGDPRHLYGQLDVLGPFLHEGNFYKFAWRYVNYADQQRRIVTGFKNLDILQRRLQLVGLRRQKEECLDLPERTFVTLSYDPTKEQRAAYNELVVASKRELEEKLRIIEDATPAARLTKLTQMLSGFVVQSNKNPRLCDGCMHLRTCVNEGIRPYTKQCIMEPVAPASTLIRFPKNPKMTALRELLDMQLAEPTNKTIVWAHYLQELDDIEETLSEAGVGYVRVDGGVSGKEVKARVKRFQEDPDCCVYVAQIATGVGIDLVAANYMIFYSLDWSLGYYLQALDRFHRIGQTRNVTVYILLCPGSVEEAVFEALQNKQDIRAALTDKDPTGQTEFEKKITRPQEI